MAVDPLLVPPTPAVVRPRRGDESDARAARSAR